MLPGAIPCKPSRTIPAKSAVPGKLSGYTTPATCPAQQRPGCAKSETRQGKAKYTAISYVKLPLPSWSGSVLIVLQILGHLFIPPRKGLACALSSQLP
jgi:hypothetical protein